MNTSQRYRPSAPRGSRGHHSSYPPSHSSNCSTKEQTRGNGNHVGGCKDESEQFLRGLQSRQTQGKPIPYSRATSCASGKKFGQEQQDAGGGNNGTNQTNLPRWQNHCLRGIKILPDGEVKYVCHSVDLRDDEDIRSEDGDTEMDWGIYKRDTAMDWGFYKPKNDDTVHTDICQMHTEGVQLRINTM